MRHFLIVFSWLVVQILGLCLLALGFECFQDHIYRAMLVVVYAVQFAVCCGIAVEKVDIQKM